MSDELKSDLFAFLKTHDYLDLATVSKEGRPLVHTVAYASEGATVYFMTNRRSRKVCDIFGNPYVAYTVHDAGRDWSAIKGVQMRAKAFIARDPAEEKRAREALIEKFQMMKDAPIDPDESIIKLEPVECDYLDYSKGFGHSDRIRFP
jgi:nitroimidazol reductase NimA-like FMN-containing flavoprotein (pyridoxamine 5'-phosphate oxidase superfamily)